MAEKDGRKSWVMVNRAPVLTLWAAAVAEVLGFEHDDEALTLGRAVAGLNAYSKGVSLGLFYPDFFFLTPTSFFYTFTVSSNECCSLTEMDSNG